MKVTDQVRKAFHSYPSPFPKLIVDLVDVPPRPPEPGFVSVRIYRDNISDMSDLQIIRAKTYIDAIMAKMREVEPDTYLEIYDYPPEAKRDGRASLHKG